MAGVTPLPIERLRLVADLAEIILQTAVDVFAATPQGAPPRARWVFGDTAEACCGAITVTLLRLPPVNQGAGNCEPSLWASEWTVDVGRDCPPGLGSAYNILPSPGAEQAFHVQMALDATVLYAAFAPLVQKRVTARVKPVAQMTGCVSFRPGSMVPYRSGDCVGARLDFSVGLSL